MQYTSLIDISMEQIKFFLTVAKMKSFTKAAEVLFVSQPLLSRRISALEREVGMALFNREKKRITLTRAGEYLYQEWNTLINRVETSIEAAREIGNGIRRRITVGYDEMLQPVDSLLLPLLEPIQEDDVNLDINLECLEYQNLRKHFMDGLIDVIITGSCSTPPNAEDLVWRNLLTLPNCVGISRKNPLADKDRIKWEDLKDETFMVISAEISEDYYRTVIGLCREHGFEPKIRTYSNKASILMNLELNNGIHVGSSIGFFNDHPLIKQYEMEGVSTHIFIGWSNTKAPSQKFVANVFEVLESRKGK